MNALQAGSPNSQRHSYTCEAVITEACFLLAALPSGNEQVFRLLQRKLLRVTFRLDDETDAVAALLERYRNVPISLADACLVRMAELYTNSTVLTLDSDFRIYRKNRRQTIPLIIPE